MRNAIININSPKQDVWGVLTGVWNQYKAGANKEWTITKTPFFIHMEAVLDAGKNTLPIAPDTTKAIYWTSKENSGSVICKAGQTVFEIPENAFVELTIYGNTGGNDGH
jgi:hypothetical protein